MKRLIIFLAIFLTLTPILRAQATIIGSLELKVAGFSARVDPTVIPKNTSSVVRISVVSGAGELTAGEVSLLLGGPFTVQGRLSGPGLSRAIDVPVWSSGVADDALYVLLPSLPDAGYYTLGDMRFIVDGEPALDIAPGVVEVMEDTAPPDANAPVLTLYSPNRFTNNTRPSICVNFTNTATGIDAFELRLDGQPVSVSSSSNTRRCYRQAPKTPNSALRSLGKMLIYLM